MLFGFWHLFHRPQSSLGPPACASGAPGGEGFALPAQTPPPEVLEGLRPSNSPKLKICNMHMAYAYFIIFDRIAGFLFRKSSYGATWSQEGYKIDEIIKNIEKNTLVFLTVWVAHRAPVAKNIGFYRCLLLGNVSKPYVFICVLERAPARRIWGTATGSLPNPPEPLQ